MAAGTRALTEVRRDIELWPLRPGVARVGTGPILRSGKNQKAPTIRRPPNRSNNGATFIALQERDDLCGVRVVPIGKLF